MSSHGHGSTLPKFGEWDVNDPATADGFSFVFIKASEEKRGGSAAAGNVTSRRGANIKLKLITTSSILQRKNGFVVFFHEIKTVPIFLFVVLLLGLICS